jgi:hypothetical protein
MARRYSLSKQRATYVLSLFITSVGERAPAVLSDSFGLCTEPNFLCFPLSASSRQVTCLFSCPDSSQSKPSTRPSCALARFVSL